MKNLFNKFSLMMLLLVLPLGFASCSDDDDDDAPSATVGTVKVTNNSSYSLTSFNVVFVNDEYEDIAIESKGTVKPSESVTVDIPIGATKYYMASTLGKNGEFYFSPFYLVSVRTQVVTDQLLNSWD